MAVTVSVCLLLDFSLLSLLLFLQFSFRFLVFGFEDVHSFACICVLSFLFVLVSFCLAVCLFADDVPVRPIPIAVCSFNALSELRCVALSPPPFPLPQCLCNSLASPNHIYLSFFGMHIHLQFQQPNGTWPKPLPPWAPFIPFAAVVDGTDMGLPDAPVNLMFEGKVRYCTITVTDVMSCRGNPRSLLDHRCCLSCLSVLSLYPTPSNPLLVDRGTCCACRLHDIHDIHSTYMTHTHDIQSRAALL